MSPGGSRCGRALLVALVGALLALACFAGVAGAAETLYWANSSGKGIGFAALDGSRAGTIGEGATTIAHKSLSFDLPQDRAYFGTGMNTIDYVDLADGSLGSLDLGGVAIGNLEGIAVDPAAGRVYFDDRKANRIGFVRVDGTGGGFLDTTGATVDGPIGIAVDPPAGRVYWLNNAGKSIAYANLDGSGGMTLPINPAQVEFNNPQGLALDPAGGRIYWTNVYGLTIYSVKLDGSDGTKLDTTGATVSNPAGLAVDAENGRLYWGNVTKAKLSFAELDGSGGGDVAIDSKQAEIAGATYPNLVKSPVVAEPAHISRSGDTLSCDVAWQPDTPAAFVYRTPSLSVYSWSQIGGIDIVATGRAFTPTTAGRYTCTVTGSNPAGSETVTSGPVDFTPLPAILPLLPAPAAPTLSGLKMAPRIFPGQTRPAAGARVAAVKAKRGATVSFRLDKPASVAFAVAARLAGRRGKGGACAKPIAANRAKPRCIRLVRRGAFTRPGVTGSNSFHFSGKVGTTALSAGGYVLSATPSFDGLAGTTASTAFTVRPTRAPRR